MSDDGATLAVVRPAPTADDLTRRVVEVYDVGTGRLLRAVTKRDSDYAEGIYDAYFVGQTLFVLEDGAGPPVVGWLDDAHTGRALSKFYGSRGLYPTRVRDDLWAFVDGDGSGIEWRHTSDGRTEARLTLDGDGHELASSAIATSEAHGGAELLVAVSGTSTALAGTVFVVDIATMHLVRKLAPPACMRANGGP